MTNNYSLTTGSLVRFQGSDEIWFARGIAPWIYFATDEDFRLAAP